MEFLIYSFAALDILLAIVLFSVSIEKPSPRPRTRLEVFLNNEPAPFDRSRRERVDRDRGQ